MKDMEWLKELRKRIALKGQQSQELDDIANDFGDPVTLARTYIEPYCQLVNPADYLEQEALIPIRQPVFKTINDFFHRPLSSRQYHVKHLIVLSDAGIGKTALLVMLKLAHIYGLWPKEHRCKLFRVDAIDHDTLESLPEPENTILLLDALDEDPAAVGRVDERLRELVLTTSRFRQTVVTCRSHYILPDHEAGLLRVGQVTVDGISCATLHLSFFDDSQVDDYLKKQYSSSMTGAIFGTEQHKCEKARRLLMQMGPLRMRPFLLAHIDDLMGAEASDWDTDSIYDALVGSWLRRERLKLTVSGDDSGSLVDGLRQACVVIASYMEQHQKQYVSANEIDSLITDTPTLRYLKAVDMGGRSLFSRNSRGDYCFVHYSLQEFFAKFDERNKLYSENDETPVELLQVFSVISAELLDYLKKHPAELHQLRPRQFEELIGEILSSYGWQVCITPASKDGGYDLFCIAKDSSGLSTSWIVECKKYAPDNKVGIEIVRGLWGVKQDLRIANAMLATTSKFTSGVHQFKSSRYDLELRDFEGIVDWLQEYKPNPDGKLYLRDKTLMLPRNPN